MKKQQQTNKNSFYWRIYTMARYLVPRAPQAHYMKEDFTVETIFHAGLSGANGFAQLLLNLVVLDNSF